jgi:hypothetical protein
MEDKTWKKTTPEIICSNATIATYFIYSISVAICNNGKY